MLDPEVRGPAVGVKACPPMVRVAVLGEVPTVTTLVAWPELVLASLILLPHTLRYHKIAGADVVSVRYMTIPCFIVSEAGFALDILIELSLIAPLFTWLLGEKPIPTNPVVVPEITP